MIEKKPKLGRLGRMNLKKLISKHPRRSDLNTTKSLSHWKTSELIESIVTATDSRKILEVGMCTGFTSLHILRSIIGKGGARLCSVDFRPAHDQKFFTSPEISPWFEFVEGATPDGEKSAHRIAGANPERHLTGERRRA